MTIGATIKRLRERKGWTLTKLSEVANVSKAYLSQLEKEPNKKVSADILFKLAEALDTTMGVLMGNEVPIATNANIPDKLKEFAEENGLSEEDTEMLAAIKYRGRQPTSKKDWEFIYNTIKTATRGD